MREKNIPFLVGNSWSHHFHEAPPPPAPPGSVALITPHTRMLLLRVQQRHRTARTTRRLWRGYYDWLQQLQDPFTLRGRKKTAIQIQIQLQLQLQQHLACAASYRNDERQFAACPFCTGSLVLLRLRSTKDGGLGAIRGSTRSALSRIPRQVSR